MGESKILYDTLQMGPVTLFGEGVDLNIIREAGTRGLRRLEDDLGKDLNILQELAIGVKVGGRGWGWAVSRLPSPP
jgi:hypothetical protein